MTGINRFGGARFGDSLPVARVDAQDLLHQENFDARFRTLPMAMESHDADDSTERIGDAIDSTTPQLDIPAEQDALRGVQPPSGEGEPAKNPFELEAAINSARVLNAMIRAGVHPSFLGPRRLREASDCLAGCPVAESIEPIATQPMNEVEAMQTFDVASPVIMPVSVPSVAIMGNPCFYARYLGQRFISRGG